MAFATLPLVTALLGAALAARLGGSAVRRFSAAKVYWAVGLLLFAAGAGAEAYGAADGWGPISFRVYYLAGGCLTVAFLGAGSAWLGVGRDAALVVSGALVASTIAATISVITASIDTAALSHATSHAPPPNSTLQGLVFVWAIALNSVGTLLVVGVSVASLLRRRRITANTLILSGVVLVAASGILTRLGSYGFVFAGQCAGLVLLAVGFEYADRTAPARRVRGLGVSGA
jgi:hypothetical protein